MGVTIHYRLGQRKEFVPKMLDDAQKFAEEIRVNFAQKTNTPFEVKRDHPYRLTVIIGNCEWLCLGFGSLKHWQDKAAKEFSYEMRTLPQSFDQLSLNDTNIMWCSGFCKTQYAEQLVEHKYVADIIRFIASRCEYVNVNDEGEYYHTLVLEDAAKSIEETGKMIGAIGGMLKEKGFESDNIVHGGETKITSLRPKKSDDTSKQ